MPDQSARNSSATVNASSVPSLVPQGSFLGKPEIALNRPVITVGSADTSRLHLVSSTVSHAHALIVRSDGQTYIADLASRSGVQVNGQTTPFAYLKSGDRVQIGRFVFRFRAPESSAPPMPPASPPPASIDLSGELPIDLGNKPFFTIGRRETNDLPLTNDRHVSTVHAVIFAIDGKWFLRDLHSRKGTRLNGSGIHQHQIDFNDSIGIGSFMMRFQPASIESAASTSGLDFSVEPAAALSAAPVEQQEMDLSLDLPLPIEDESAAIPLEVDEPQA
jgi:pSer/pThr/pTyr-binding forkhead associated (FHA) protein